MSSLKYLLAFAIIVATFASTTFAFECYDCDVEAGCGLPGSSKVDCSSAYTLAVMNAKSAEGCLKINKKTAGGGVSTTRTCYFGIGSLAANGCYDKDVSCFTCTGEMCNGSSTTAPIAIIIVAMFALARVFF